MNLSNQTPKPVIALGCALVFSVAIQGQTLMPQSAKLQAGELGAQAITAKAGAILDKVGLPKPDFQKSKVLLHVFPGWRRQWDIFANPYWIQLDPRSGELLAFFNQGRRKAQYLGRGRTGKVAFSNSKDRKQYLIKTAIAFGMPTTSKITGLDSVDEGKVQDANRTGYFGIGMYDEKTRLACSMSCDVQDGTVTEFMMWHRKQGLPAPVYK